MKTKEAKDFSKSETGMADVMDTLQHAISIIEKETAKNLTFLQKEIGTLNTNNVMVSDVHHKGRPQCQQLSANNVNDEAYQEQITDVSYGNTAAFVGIDRFL